MTSHDSTNCLARLVDVIKAKPDLDVFSGEHYAGQLSKESVYAFTYDRSVRQDAECEVSIGLPYRVRSYSSGDLFGVFSMNEPEGYLRLYIEQAMSRYGIPNKLIFLALSHGLQIGRVSYQHADMQFEANLTETLDDILEKRDAGFFDRLLARYALRSNLSGAQPKVIVPTSLDSACTGKASVFMPSVIVKEAGQEFPGLTLNEYFCLSVARHAGFNVPDFWLSEDGSRFVIQRFDRDHRGQSLGFEDMAVLAGVTAKEKYQGSYESVMRMAFAYCSTSEGALVMLDQIVLSILLKDGDAHLKNFGVLYTNPKTDVSPSPVYDVVCTAISPDLDQELALKMNKTRRYPTRKTLINFANKLSIEKQRIDDVIDRVQASIDHVLSELSHDARFLADPNQTLSKLKAVLRPLSPV